MTYSMEIYAIILCAVCHSEWKMCLQINSGIVLGYQ